MDDVTAFKTLEPVVDHAPGRQQRDRDLWRSHHSDRDRLVYFSPAATADIGSGFRGLQDPHRSLPPAWPRGAGGRRYRENHRARVDVHEPHSARRTRAGSHFLSWTLVLEIEGRWPWQREPSPMSSRAHAGRETDAH